MTSTPTSSEPLESAAQAEAHDTAQFDEIDAILDEMRTRYDETPQWEFCEGFMAALICCRQPIAQDEYLDVLPPADRARRILGRVAGYRPGGRALCRNRH